MLLMREIQGHLILLTFIPGHKRKNDHGGGWRKAGLSGDGALWGTFWSKALT